MVNFNKVIFWYCFCIYFSYFVIHRVLWCIQEASVVALLQNAFWLMQEINDWRIVSTDLFLISLPFACCFITVSHFYHFSLGFKVELKIKINYYGVFCFCDFILFLLFYSELMTKKIEQRDSEWHVLFLIWPPLALTLTSGICSYYCTNSVCQRTCQVQCLLQVSITALVLR